MLVGTLDAMALLASGHRTLETLIGEYMAAPAARHRAIAAQICSELAIHAALETGVLYPTLEETAGSLLPARQLLATVRAQHDMLGAIARSLQRPHIDDAALNASTGLLQMQLAGHVGLEETQLFPLAKRVIRDLDELAGRLEDVQYELGVEVALL